MDPAALPDARPLRHLAALCALALALACGPAQGGSDAAPAGHAIKKETTAPADGTGAGRPAAVGPAETAGGAGASPGTGSANGAYAAPVDAARAARPIVAQLPAPAGGGGAGSSSTPARGTRDNPAAPPQTGKAAAPPADAARGAGAGQQPATPAHGATQAAPGAGDAPPVPMARGEQPARGETVDQAICRLIDAAAAQEGLPASFLTRLIWRESSFRSDVVSHKGAQGIAQFMPGTARERGLDNPFDPQAAIPASAALLADLNRKFGNLGLAAAAYNAGPGRVNGFLSGGSLPGETRTYVRLITGRPAEDWAALRKQGAAADAPPPFPAEPCLVTVASLRKGAPAPAAGEPVNPLFAPWGAQISGNYSREIALASFRREAARHPQVFADQTPVIVATRGGGRGPRTFYRVRLPAQTKQEAMRICDRLRRAGGACLALPN